MLQQAPDDAGLSDFFGGGGGVSEAARRVAGLTLRFAADHWPTAVETNRANHPHAEHRCADLSQMDPRSAPATEIMWASPSCTYHAQSQGAYRETEAAKQSRATMWCAVAFAERHRYQAIGIENVLEARKWVLWPAWTQALEALGYHLQVVSLNSAHVGRVAQSRDRLYVLATLAPPPNLDHLTSTDAMCLACGPVLGTRVGRFGRYRRQYRYVCPLCLGDVEPVTLPGSSVIDSTNLGLRVGDRYAARTRWKIGLGIERFGGAPFVAELRGGGSTVRSLADPLSTITAGGRHHLIVTPDGPRVEDAWARIATTQELAAGQGFPADYRWAGTDEDIARQVGNAVSVPTAAAVLSTLVGTLT